MDRSVLKYLSSLRFNAYKSFNSKGPFLLPLGQNITLIIGRNNCGKSSLIDVIEEFIVESSTGKANKNIDNLCSSFILDEEHLSFGFLKDRRNSKILGFEYDYAAKRCLNKSFTAKVSERGYEPDFDQVEDVFLNWDASNNSIIGNWEMVLRNYKQEFQNVAMLRVNAERDLIPEKESDDERVGKNGLGATNLLRKYINTDSYDESIVEKTILSELNKIMEPDAHFGAIRIQQIKDISTNGYNWEIFLEESGYRYAISKSGSGLKTILLILINLYLIPDTKHYRNKEICYAFEEIENNLHPALQRRIFEYLYSFAEENNTLIFITSHSHIAINTFYDKEKTKLFHVIKEGGNSELIHISNGLQRKQILDDLDVKASDLFQTNGIIWVEGPSDRIYILQWLKVFTDFRFVEGLHFQFMYYGGKLLAHYEAEEREQRTDGLINVLTTNHNAAIVIDSDKRTSNSRINETKRRIRSEFHEKGYFCWITKGKEIENYVSAKAVNKYYGCNLPQIEQYEEFPDYIRKWDKQFSSHKVDVARRLCENINEENSGDILDLKKQINDLFTCIKQWNSHYPEISE